MSAGNGVVRAYVLLLPAVLAVSACTHTVIAPARPEQPRAAFLLDHGRHASLVLERADGITRYSYGHWSYYAENRTGLFRASGTLFGNDRAALGRRHFAGAAELDIVRHRVRVPVEAAWRIDVPAARAAALIDELDILFEAGAPERIDNRLYDLEFVPHPDPYHLGHNSNHVIGEWLRRLGCRVDMSGPLSSWHVAYPASQQPP